MISTSLRRPTSVPRPLSRTSWTVTFVAATLLSAATLRAQQVADSSAKKPAAPDTAHPAASDTARTSAVADTTRAVAADTTHAAVRASATTVAAAAPDTGAVTQTTDSTKTHTVKKGDTLWDLAGFYLSNPFLWPQIYQLNTDVVHNPHWIYPGERLRLPNGQTIVVGETPKPDSTVVAALPDSTAPDTVASVTDTLLFLRDTATVGPHRGTTVFGEPNDDGLNGNSRRGAAMDQQSRTAVREGEFYAAPWVGPVGGPSDAGELIANVEIPGIANAAAPNRLTIGDRAYMTPPADAVPMRGDRYMTIALGPELRSGGQLVTPTGIVEVERVSDGDAVTVRVVKQFRTLEIGNAVIPLEKLVMASGARPTPLELGPQATVVYVPSQAVLPSILYYIVLNATLQDGVKVGDQFTLFRPRVRTTRGITLPEEPIALAQVVRVTERGVTGIIIDQRHPAIKEGTVARLTARMP